jgi:hypothetical protein
MSQSHIFNAELSAIVGEQRQSKTDDEQVDVKGTKVNYKNLSGGEYDFKAR